MERYEEFEEFACGDWAWCAVWVVVYGGMWSERELVGFAYAYEQVSMHRGEGRPYLVPGVELVDVV